MASGRMNHVTEHQLVRRTEQLHDGFSENKYSVGLFLDIAKAFDKVSINGLIYKLITLGFPPALITILISYLIGRKFKVLIRKSYFQLKKILSGVPQGSLIASLLYLIFANGLPGQLDIFSYFFADDAAFIIQGLILEIIIKLL